MTEIEFRKSEPYIQRMREIIADPVFQTALIVLKDKPLPFLADDAPEIASVRALSRIAGREEILSELFTLATPFVPPVELGEPTYEPETPES